jgi:hypothetical protein
MILELASLCQPGKERLAPFVLGLFYLKCRTNEPLIVMPALHQSSRIRELL